jgi:hypothetical protein
MYAARPEILRLTGRDKLNDKYFTQVLLPDYVALHPEQCRNWDVVFDARGTFTEPHTGRTVPLGTIEVRARRIYGLPCAGRNPASVSGRNHRGGCFRSARALGRSVPCMG